MTTKSFVYIFAIDFLSNKWIWVLCNCICDALYDANTQFILFDIQQIFIVQFTLLFFICVTLFLSFHFYSNEWMTIYFVHCYIYFFCVFSLFAWMFISGLTIINKQIELENLNTATEEINKLELELEVMIIIFLHFVFVIYHLYFYFGLYLGSWINISYIIKWIDTTFKIIDKKIGQLYWKIGSVLWKFGKGSSCSGRMSGSR